MWKEHHVLRNVVRAQDPRETSVFLARVDLAQKVIVDTSWMFLYL